MLLLVVLELVEATEKKKEMIKDGSEEDDEEEEDDASYWVTSQRCNVCLSALGDQSMLVCDGCDELYHMHCLNPPLEEIPDGDWYCDACVAYDDDISSTVELEGCNGFVIESRKRSVAEEEERGTHGFATRLRGRNSRKSGGPALRRAQGRR